MSKYYICLRQVYGSHDYYSVVEEFENDLPTEKELDMVRTDFVPMSKANQQLYHRTSYEVLNDIICMQKLSEG